MAVRTRRIASGSTPVGPSLIYTVPADRTLIVRWVQCEFFAVGNNQVFRLLHQVPGATSAIFRVTGNLSDAFQAERWAPCNPGDLLIVESTLPGVRFMVGGALLLGAPA